MNGPWGQANQEPLERDDVRQFDYEDPLGLQPLPNDREESEWVAGMFEDVDAKNNVVLRALDLDLFEVHDAVLMGIETTPSLGLQHVDPDHVGRFPDLETLLTGLDVQYLENPVAREDRVDESLRSSVLHIAQIEFGLVLEVFHGARETTSEHRVEPREAVSSVSAGVGHQYLASRQRRSAHPLWKEGLNGDHRPVDVRQHVHDRPGSDGIHRRGA